MTKQSMRAKYKNLRAQIAPAKALHWSQEMTQQLFHLLRSQNFQGTLFLFAPMSGEPDFLTFMPSVPFHVALPRTQPNRSLTFHLWHRDAILQQGPFGLFEPDPTEIEMLVAQGDIAVVPALALDRWGNRLGFGAGYYDRWLGLNRNNFKKIIGAVFPPFIEHGALPHEPHDVVMDIVLGSNLNTSNQFNTST